MAKPVPLLGGAYQSRSVIASAQRIACVINARAYIKRHASPSRSNRPSIRSSHSYCSRCPGDQERTVVDLSLRLRQSEERSEHGAYLWPHQILRMLSEAICRSHRPKVRGLDSIGPQCGEASARTLVMPMRVRHRADGFWVQPSQRRGYTMYAQTGYFRPDVWEMDGYRAREESAILALPLRVWDRTGGGEFKSHLWRVRVMRLHDRDSSQGTAYPSWSCRQQDVLGLGVDAAEMPEPEQQGVLQVWGARYPSLARLGYLRGLRARYGSNLCSGFNARPHQRERQLLFGQLHVDTACHAGRKSSSLLGVETSWRAR
jgi:hypothetical protein